jgi:hypothetical protein
MNKLHYFILATGLILPTSLSAQFEGATESARSTALGGMFTPLGDDPSTLSINCAGLVNSASLALYGDFAEASDDGYGAGTMIAVVYRVPWFTMGAGWYRRDASAGGIEDENLLVAGVARKLISNVGGSYLSVGAAVKVGRIAYESSCDCPGGGSAESNVTGDFGLILRPLPVISIGYSMLNAMETEFEDHSPARSWSRVSRWGISYFWEERVIVGFEQQRWGGSTTYHYGIAVRTSTPVEILAGFDDGDVQGGIRWVDETVRVSAAFGSDGDGGVHARASIEVSIGKTDDE